MLQSLVIRNIVLIEYLELTFSGGLCVLTGETGAGKSVFLDALGLAIGGRADARLVRHGRGESAVIATFSISPDDKVRIFLDEYGITVDQSGLILRRTLKSDGSSKAFINDQPVSISFLKRVGSALVDFHGQFENQRLLKPSVHRELLDSYGKLDNFREEVQTNFKTWKSLSYEKVQFKEKLEKSRDDEAYLLHAINELNSLAPIPGEEEKLASQRRIISNLSEIANAVSEALNQLRENQGVDERLKKAAILINKVSDKAEGRLDGIVSAIDRTINESIETINLLEHAINDADLSPKDLDLIEERLFALRACARKHGVQVEDLPKLNKELSAKKDFSEKENIYFKELEKKERLAREKYIETAKQLTLLRNEAANSLDIAVGGELEAIEMMQSCFSTQVTIRNEEGWGKYGADDVSFLVSTNPGVPLGPITKIASGGEVARLMLAIKVVLAKADPMAVVVFDEVDSGVGGAVASAVGERLLRLAIESQVLVVTHSPQVAAKGLQHFLVAKSLIDSKNNNGEKNLTTISILNYSERAEEIARMLSGKKITAEARAAATSLLESSS